MTLNYIGLNIRKKREEKGWSREQFAEKVSISRDYVGMIKEYASPGVVICVHKK